ncbi:siphovirus Gp157 family protein [Brevibacillus sp. DP1.3A]|uniref:siphovirus Gp157 family protein n=1 Tax=Brevibacillus sp. DP1.3A TaxID=2738867 RepID=UPI00156B859B|nr:siphovirus Gp157 family protein [Brevibacillus sp. DP1.3A]UED76077.1 siphovirus Gp157 family protein [Brevibacillus sp. DP1.3A]
MNLYEMADQYAAILQVITEDETHSVGLADALEALKDAIEVKAENIVKMMKNIDGYMEVIRNEEKRLADRRRTLEIRRDGLKRYLEDQLGKAGLNHIKTPIFTVSLQKNAPSVQVLNESIIPSNYWVNTAPTLNKTMISELLKKGEEIPGVALHQGSSLRIR